MIASTLCFLGAAGFAAAGFATTGVGPGGVSAGVDREIASNVTAMIACIGFPWFSVAAANAAV